MLMTTDYDLFKLGVFAQDATCSMSAYAYDAYAHIMNRHTNSDGSIPAQRLVPPTCPSKLFERRRKRLRVGGGFLIYNDGPTSYSGTADTTTWYAYDYDVSRWLSRDPLGEEAFFRQYTSDRDIREMLGLWNKSHDPLYVFVQNSPTSFLDPLGLVTWKCIKCHLICHLKCELAGLVACGVICRANPVCMAVCEPAVILVCAIICEDLCRKDCEPCF